MTFPERSFNRSSNFFAYYRGCSFCDYSGSGDIVTLEQTAINAFIAMEQSLTTLPSDVCKVKMRQWMCWQVRTRSAEA